MSDPEVQAQRLPGIGWRYTVPADLGRDVVVVAEDRGARHLVLVDPRLDEALTTVRLPAQHASVLAALLTGARFTVTTSDEVAGAGATEPQEVIVETLRVTSGSPVVGLTQDEVAPRLGTDAVLLAIIDDRTPALVEPDSARAIRQGDKLVVAARRGLMESLRRAV
jgi:K+/H+ antiporter YhaU regulatory subunit KhtT